MSMLTEAHIDAVQACIDNAKAILARDGVNRDSLAAVKAHLLLLAAHDDLFAAWNFQILEDHAGAHGTIYRLAEDDDHSFAMFAVAQCKGNMAPPHDHTTWAMIAGVEVNRFYERLDDGSVLGRAQIGETREEAIEKGTGVALMPDDIHSIHCLCDEPTLALHFYGRSIAQLPEHKKFNTANGTYSHFSGQPNIHNL